MERGIPVVFLRDADVAKQLLGEFFLVEYTRVRLYAYFSVGHFTWRRERGPEPDTKVMVVVLLT